MRTAIRSLRASIWLTVAWADGRDFDIYAMRMKDDGTPDTPSWTLDGNRVTHGDSSQITPEISSDGSGGAFIVWRDHRTGASTQADIFAQRVDGSGQIVSGWPTNGVMICNAAFDQNGPRIVPDGFGGAVMCWDDRRTTSTTGSDIYAQRVDGSGNVVSGWPANGVAITTAINDQDIPVIAPDAGGGAVIAWHSFDNTGDVYVQRVTGNGTVAGVTGVEEGPSSTVAFTVAPNPASKRATLAFPATVGTAVRLAIYDLNGRRIRRLGAPSNGVLARVDWNLSDDSGKHVAPGLYWVRGQIGALQINKTVIVLR